MKDFDIVLPDGKIVNTSQKDVMPVILSVLVRDGQRLIRHPIQWDGEKAVSVPFQRGRLERFISWFQRLTKEDDS